MRIARLLSTKTKFLERSHCTTAVFVQNNVVPGIWYVLPILIDHADGAGSPSATSIRWHCHTYEQLCRLPAGWCGAAASANMELYIRYGT